MNRHNTEAYSALWSALHSKFCDSLKHAFSSQDIDAWLKHFYPNRKVDVLQFGQDVTGKSGAGNTVRVFTGGWVRSMLKGRPPMKVMAQVLFKRLNKQGYSYSEIDLLGIRLNDAPENTATALVSFERVNGAGKKYASAVVVYSLEQLDRVWLITQLANYDKIEDLPIEHTPEKLWHPIS